MKLTGGTPLSWTVSSVRLDWKADLDIRSGPLRNTNNRSFLEIIADCVRMCHSSGMSCIF